jgi:hypothetical protein
MVHQNRVIVCYMVHQNRVIIVCYIRTSEQGDDNSLLHGASEQGDSLLHQNRVMIIVCYMVHQNRVMIIVCYIRTG